MNNSAHHKPIRAGKTLGTKGLGLVLPEVDTVFLDTGLEGIT